MDRANAIEASLRVIKRNITSTSLIQVGAPLNTEKEEQIADNSLSEQSEQEIMFPAVANDLSANHQVNQNDAGFAMIWDEIDELRNKFDDFVH